MADFGIPLLNCPVKAIKFVLNVGLNITSGFYHSHFGGGGWQFLRVFQLRTLKITVSALKSVILPVCQVDGVRVLCAEYLIHFMCHRELWPT